MSIAIKIENLSKQYRLGTVGAKTFKEDSQRFWAKLRGKEDPFLKLGTENDRTLINPENRFVWSLKDINLEINKGDVLGVIGRNGAGKSTLLKILSKVTAPTTGKISVNGRIASLLEVGTGFHPELTGRENIYLNGAILGMRKNEISRKLDEIVDFAGVQLYIDTPVKRYSSGMYVRLAFAVAAHLEPEILIVDEVLAVGDSEFQSKCLGKMKDVSNEGRTILFVSHNIAAIKNLCNKGLLLSNGQLNAIGDINSVISTYQKLESPIHILLDEYVRKNLENKSIELTRAKIQSEDGLKKSIFDISEKIIIKLEIQCLEKISGIYGYVTISNDEEMLFIETDTKDFLPNVIDNINIGLNKYELVILNNTLPIGEYKVYLNFSSTYNDNYSVDTPGYVLRFKISDNSTVRSANRKSLTSHLLYWNKIC